MSINTISQTTLTSLLISENATSDNTSNFTEVNGVTVSAVLEAQSDAEAILITRLNQNAIDSLITVDGMLTYNNTSNKFIMRQDGTWVDIAGTSSGSGGSAGEIAVFVSDGSSTIAGSGVFIKNVVPPSSISGKLLKSNDTEYTEISNVGILSFEDPGLCFVGISPIMSLTTDSNSNKNSIVVTDGNILIPTNDSALFEISSTTGTILLPRMTTVQIGALEGTDGMIVYNSDVDKFLIHENGAWVNIGTGSGSGSVTSVQTGTGLVGGPITITGTISIANTGVVSGTYNYASITVNAQGQLTAASNGAPPITTINTGIGLTGGPIVGGIGTISIEDTSVLPGTYNYASITVNAQGQLTAASNGVPPVISVSGTAARISSSGGTTPVIDLIATGVSAGNYPYSTITVDAYGRITAASSGSAPVTSVSGTAGNISSTGGMNPIINLIATAVTPGSYTYGGFTVDAYGRITAASSGTSPVTSIAITGSTGLTVSGSPITSSGTIALTLGTELQGLSTLSSNGIVTRTFSGTYASRIIAVGSSNLTVLNSSGVGGNPTLDLGTTTVSAGSYTYSSITVDAYGRLTSASSGTTPVISVSGTAARISSSGGTTPVIDLIATGVSAGNYPYSTITVDAYGRITAASSGSAPVTSVSGTAGNISSTGGMNPIINLIATAVTPGSYTYGGFTVDSYGRLTAASSGATPVISVTGTSGRISSTGGATPVLDLITTTVTAGNYTYGGFTVDAYGRITAASSGTSPVTSIAITGSTGLTVSGSPITSSGTIALTLGTELQGLSALSANGIVVRSISGLYTSRSIAVGSANLTITNGNGVSGNPTLDLGTTTVSAGSYTNSNITVDAYGRITAASTGASSGTVTSIAITGSTGLTVSGSPITSSGTISLNLNAQLQGLSSLSANGIVTRTASGTYTSRSIAVGSANLTITNGNGVSGNPTLDLSLTPTGLTSIGVGQINLTSASQYINFVSTASTIANQIEMWPGNSGNTSTAAYGFGMRASTLCLNVPANKFIGMYWSGTQHAFLSSDNSTYVQLGFNGSSNAYIGNYTNSGNLVLQATPPGGGSPNSCMSMNYNLLSIYTNTIISNTLQVSGNSPTPASGGGSLYLAGGYTFPNSGKIIFGDGSGWNMTLSKSNASVITDLFTFDDSGNLIVAGNLIVDGRIDSSTPYYYGTWSRTGTYNTISSAAYTNYVVNGFMSLGMSAATNSSVTISKSGNYEILVSFLVNCGTNGAAIQTLVGYLTLNGSELISTELDYSFTYWLSFKTNSQITIYTYANLSAGDVLSTPNLSINTASGTISVGATNGMMSVKYI